MSSFSAGHIKQSVRIRANVNLAVTVTSAKNGVKHNTRKKLAY